MASYGVSSAGATTSAGQQSNDVDNQQPRPTPLIEIIATTIDDTAGGGADGPQFGSPNPPPRVVSSSTTRSSSTSSSATITSSSTITSTSSHTSNTAAVTSTSGSGSSNSSENSSVPDSVLRTEDGETSRTVFAVAGDHEQTGTVPTSRSFPALPTESSRDGQPTFDDSNNSTDGQDSNTQSAKKVPTPTVVGAVLGSLAILSILVLIFAYLRRRRRRRPDHDDFFRIPGSPSPQPLAHTNSRTSSSIMSSRELTDSPPPEDLFFDGRNPRYGGRLPKTPPQMRSTRGPSLSISSDPFRSATPIMVVNSTRMGRDEWTTFS